uniref:Ribosomal protein S4 n=1 Tax=Proteomonas sulcata TaxID=77928 RepID=A0A2P1G8A2_9CRYP|nr:ribosomal protein S4 [Proteomonas sulcata]AVM81182.1 ribosomal protein S4 [Proteomonas sulcata]
MTKRLTAKFSVCKKLKKKYKNVWGLNKGDSLRSTHYTQKKRKGLSSFGHLLNTKQCLKAYYCNLTEKTFKILLRKSIKSSLNTLDKFISLVEMRLDVILFRAAFVSSLYKARQLINHGVILVNSKPVFNMNKKIAQYDIIEFRCKEKQFYDQVLSDLKFNINTRSFSSHLEIDYRTMRILVLWEPKFSNVYYPIKADYSTFYRLYK